MIKIIAKKEVNLSVKTIEFIGIYEHNLKNRHDISHVFLVESSKGKIKLDFQSTDAKFFKKRPNNMISIQKKMWNDAKKIKNNFTTY